MKKINTLLAIPCLLALTFSISSCNNEPKENETDNDMVNDSIQLNENRSADEVFTFVLPSPIQVAAIFNRAGLKFSSDVLNPVSNLNKYNTKTSRYLNFGVYSSDLAFCVMNDKQQLAIDYMNTLKKLADDIGMPTVFSEEKLIESFEKNIGNQDSMLYILSKVKQRTDEYLEENSEESKAAIFFAGAWVEGMYIGSNNIQDNSKLKSRLLEQMVILKNLIKALEMQNDPSFDLEFLINDLQGIYTDFKNFEGVKNMEKNNTDIFDVEVNESEMESIRTQIKDLRTKIIEG